MAQYVDGFVLPVPKKNIAAYARMAREAGKVWREHGALEFRECVGDDLSVKNGSALPARNQDQGERDGLLFPGSFTNRKPIAIASTPR